MLASGEQVIQCGASLIAEDGVVAIVRPDEFGVRETGSEFRCSVAGEVPVLRAVPDGQGCADFRWIEGPPAGIGPAVLPQS